MSFKHGWTRGLAFAAIVSLAGCAAAPATTPEPTQAKPGADRQVMAVGDPAELGQVLANIPASISAADAPRLLVSLDASQIVSPPGGYTVQQATGDDGSGGMQQGGMQQGGMQQGDAQQGGMQQGAMLVGAGNPANNALVATRTNWGDVDAILYGGWFPFYRNYYGSFNYYPYGNYLIPYYNNAGTYYPYSYLNAGAWPYLWNTYGLSSLSAYSNLYPYFYRYGGGYAPYHYATSRYGRVGGRSWGGLSRNIREHNVRQSSVHRSNIKQSSVSTKGETSGRGRR